MRFFLIVYILLFLLNCKNPQNNESISNLSISSDSISENKKIVPKYIEKNNAPESKKLNGDNAMAFFQDYDKKHKEDKVRITTDFGTIDIQLFPETKYHRANFIFLTKQNYFEGTQFYRVVNNFVIQGGNSDDMEVAKKRAKIGTYLLPPDTKQGYKHDRGIISMPSSEIDDAYKMASPYQFFIVQGANGAHHLDKEYTAFGKVIDGMDVVDKIAAQKTDDSEWPLNNVYIRRVEIIK